MFGYIKEVDPRSKSFPLTLLLDPIREAGFPTGVPIGERHYPVFTSPVLDQGNTGTCVAHGGTSLIEGAPVMQKRPMSPFDLYRKVILRDDFKANDREANLPDSQLQYGTSTLALMKVLQDLGYIKSYLWAETATDVRAWHLVKGVMGFGFPWSTGMMDTDSEGFIKYTGDIEGGHFVKTTGFNDLVKHNGVRVPAVRIQNSWSRSWGQSGRCWLSLEDVAKLLADGGEAVAPTEIKVKAA